MNKFAIIAALVAFTGARHHHHHRADPYSLVRIRSYDDAVTVEKAAAAEDAAKKEIAEEEKKSGGKSPAEKSEAKDAVAKKE